MDAYEATRIVFSRIQNLDPENASKIMGLLLIQDHGEKEMIRLAFGPESLLHSVIVKARNELGLLSNTPSTPSTPSSPSPFLSNNSNHLNPLSLSRQNSTSSSRLLGGGFNLPSPLSIPNPSSSSASSSWGASGFADLVSPSTTTSTVTTSTANSASYPSASIGSSSISSSMNSSAPPFYATGTGAGGGDVMIDEFQLQDQLSFLNDGSPTLGPKNPDSFYPQNELASSPSGDSVLFSSYANWGGGSGNGLSHRRSCSVSEISLGSEDLNCGWKPCLYYARGYCKNGNSCRFLHVDSRADGGAAMVGSPGKLEMMEQCHELLRSKQQQRLLAASQLMNSSSSNSFPFSPTNKSINFFLQQQQQTDGQRAAAALMLGEDMHKFARTRLERNEFQMNGVSSGMVNPGSRQIYLTFPADSTFREEDVSNYFSIYGPVQDVRIPYQQKRMFGFVTFVYPETVKLILAKGNPHFVCDARVLVKPYKEKGKVPDKYRKHQQQPQMDGGEFSACGSPTGLESRDPFDLQLGARMFYNTQDMLWRKKLEEQADLQQAIELQGRRLMDLQFLDVKRQNHHRALSTGAAIPSPKNFFSQPFVLPSDRNNSEILEENGFIPAISAPPTAKVHDAQQLTADLISEKEKISYNSNPTENGNGNGSGKESPHSEQSDFQESLEHNLPDNLFASPKASGNYMTAFTNAAGQAEKSEGVSSSPSPSSVANSSLVTSTLLPATSTLDMASFKSCFFQAPRFSSGHGVIEM